MHWGVAAAMLRLAACGYGDGSYAALAQRMPLEPAEAVFNELVWPLPDALNAAEEAEAQSEVS
jgi:hypothetical protein